MFTRRYLLQETAFELFADNLKVYYWIKQVYFFTLFEQRAQKIMTEAFQLHKWIQVVTNRRDEWRQKCLTQKWIDGNLSNYHYLILMNTYSGRTFNDLN